MGTRTVSTPAEAMTADRTSIVQNADRFERTSPEDRSRLSARSSSGRRWISGSTRSRSPLSMPSSIRAGHRLKCNDTGA
jgi:hypothetical protein